MIPAPHIRALAQVPPVPRLIQQPNNSLRKAEEDGPSTWAPATQVGNPDGDPGSCFQPDPAPNTAGNLGVNQ